MASIHFSRSCFTSLAQIDLLLRAGEGERQTHTSDENTSDENTSDENETIQYLNCDFNSISAIPLRKFPLALKALPLTRFSAANNLLDTIDGLVVFADTLQTLDLSHNRLESISILHSCEHLRSVCLANNNLSSPCLRTLSSLHTLAHLDLSGNGLIDATVPWTWPSLTHLTLSNNKLVSFSCGAYPKLTVLNVSGNDIALLELSQNPVCVLKGLDVSGNVELSLSGVRGRAIALRAMTADEGLARSLVDLQNGGGDDDDGSAFVLPSEAIVRCNGKSLIAPPPATVATESVNEAKSKVITVDSEGEAQKRQVDQEKDKDSADVSQTEEEDAEDEDVAMETATIAAKEKTECAMKEEGGEEEGEKEEADETVDVCAQEDKEQRGTLGSKSEEYDKDVNETREDEYNKTKFTTTAKQAVEITWSETESGSEFDYEAVMKAPYQEANGDADDFNSLADFLERCKEQLQTIAEVEVKDEFLVDEATPDIAAVDSVSAPSPEKHTTSAEKRSKEQTTERASTPNVVVTAAAAATAVAAAAIAAAAAASLPPLLPSTDTHVRTTVTNDAGAVESYMDKDRVRERIGQRYDKKLPASALAPGSSGKEETLYTLHILREYLAVSPKKSKRARVSTSARNKNKIPLRSGSSPTRKISPLRQRTSRSSSSRGRPRTTPSYASPLRRHMTHTRARSRVVAVPRASFVVPFPPLKARKKKKRDVLSEIHDLVVTADRLRETQAAMRASHESSVPGSVGASERQTVMLQQARSNLDGLIAMLESDNKD